MREGSVEVKVKKTNDGYIVTEPNGVERYLSPLYFGQMVYSYKGRFYYDKEIPIDYFKKAELLRSDGWETGYHYEDWYRLEKGWTEYGGIKTDDAIKICLSSRKETNGEITRRN